MRPPGFIPATFVFTPNAREMIERMRRDIELRDGRPIGAVGFAWGHVQMADGAKHEQPVVGVYDHAQMDAVARASVQTVDGIDLIVFSTPDQATNFDGRTIDFSAERGFFVADA